jgi:hypothetical protein
MVKNWPWKEVGKNHLAAQVSGDGERLARLRRMHNRKGEEWIICRPRGVAHASKDRSA